MSSSGRAGKNASKADSGREKRESTLAAQASRASPTHFNEDAEKEDSAILRELKDLRRENQEAHNTTQVSVNKLEKSMSQVKDWIEKTEGRIEEMESEISKIDDRGLRHERALRYLVKRDAEMTAKCEDLQNRLRRNNIRIYQVPEGSEGKDVKEFVKELLLNTLKVSSEVDMKIERAHRSLTAKPTHQSAPPRSIIARFLDSTVKEHVLQLAWGQEITFQGQRIYFDHDYSPDLQKRRGQVRQVIKQLKVKGIRARCPYPARLRMTTDSGEKVFETLVDAIPTLKELGINVQIDERERLQMELTRDRWQVQGKARDQRRQQTMTPLSSADIKTLMNEDDV